MQAFLDAFLLLVLSCQSQPKSSTGCSADKRPSRCKPTQCWYSIQRGSSCRCVMGSRYDQALPASAAGTAGMALHKTSQCWQRYSGSRRRWQCPKGWRARAGASKGGGPCGGDQAPPGDCRQHGRRLGPGLSQNGSASKQHMLQKGMCRQTGREPAHHRPLVMAETSRPW